MKKIFFIALFFSLGCLISTPTSAPLQQIQSTATLRKVTPTQKISSAPSVRATSTSAPTLQPPPQWKFSPPAPAKRSIYKADLAPEYHAILNELPFASLYSIYFNIAADLVHISGHETVTYTNAEAEDLQEIYIRLYANMLNGTMSVKNVRVDGEGVVLLYALNDSLLILQLNKPLHPAEKIVIDIDFEIKVAESIGSHYSVQTNFNNVLALAHAYPMIAVYDDEGWNAEIPAQYGDLTYADMSFFVVTVEAPQDVVLVGSGHEIKREESGNRQRATYSAGPIRDFMVAASSEYSVVSKKSNGVTLRFYARESEKEGALYALDSAARALEIYKQRYATYPYRELDFVATSTDASGIEYPGMIAIARQYLTPNNGYLDALIAHEVGHQWFYNLVGNDQLDEPWLDESLTQFATLQYFADAYGETGAEIFRADLESRWEGINNALIPIGQPVSAYSNAEYRGIIYGRGALFFIALRDELGADVFDDFLRHYTQSSAWQIATTATFKAKAEEVCACDLADIFQNWIYP